MVTGDEHKEANHLYQYAPGGDAVDIQIEAREDGYEDSANTDGTL